MDLATIAVEVGLALVSTAAVWFGLRQWRRGGRAKVLAVALFVVPLLSAAGGTVFAFRERIADEAIRKSIQNGEELHLPFGPH